MKLDDIVKQLANRINQPHYIEAMLQKVVKGAYEKGLQDGKELKSDLLHNVSKSVCQCEIPSFDFNRHHCFRCNLKVGIRPAN